MCGIVGTWDSSAPVNVQMFDRMTESLAARGPDGQGTVSLDDGRLMLGHRRLAIIDLSASGDQPMCNEDASLWLVFNGEIYNYQVLRKELEQRGHRFRSHSDSETIIHAYEEWGKQCVLRLRGIFAFAIYDCRKHALFLARDQIGVKPLYFHRSHCSFAFASQPRAILAAETFRPTVDSSAFALFLAYGNVPREYCIFRGIEKLRPGYWLFLRDGRIDIQQYWQLRYAPVVFDSPTAVELVREKIEEGVLLQAISDVPIGTLLSGGVDSTIITSILAQQSESPLASFSIGFNEEESDESPYARLVADYLHTDHHQQTLTYEAACALVPDIVAAMDEPFHLNSLFPYFAVSRLARSHGIKVVLGGDGADELFAGYLWYDAFRDAMNQGYDRDGLRHIYWPFGHRRRRRERAVRLFFPYNGSFGYREQQGLLGKGVGTDDPDFIYLPLNSAWMPNVPPVLTAQIFDFHCFLVDHCLTKVDRMSMACGLEVRVPLLDVELVEAAFSIDHNLVYHQSERKALLKTAMSSHFPPAMKTARKKGFSSPLPTWLNTGLGKLGLKYLLSGSMVSRGLIDPGYLEGHFATMDAGRQLLLISGELWARRWIEGDSESITLFAHQLIAR